MKVEFEKLPTWTTPEELAYLTESSKLAGHILESGTYIGASAIALLEGNHWSHLWTVDFFKAFAFNQEVATIFLSEYIKTARCEIICGDMDKAGEMLAHMRGRFDLAWVDDGHAEEDLKRDIRNILPLMRSGGKILFHDWDGDNNVARGIKSMLPVEKIKFPVGRIAEYIKP